MNKYLVISYNADEQESFHDYVMAESGEQATEKVNNARGYAIVVCAYEAHNLLSEAETLIGMTDEDVAESWDDTIEAIREAQEGVKCRHCGNPADGGVCDPCMKKYEK